MIRKFGRWKPSIDGNAIIDETAIIMGNVSAGKAFIFPHAMIRADEHKVVIEDNVAILDKAFIEAHSDVLIEILRGNEKVRELLEKFIEEDYEICIPHLVIYEILFGAFRRSEKEVVKVYRLIGDLVSSGARIIEISDVVIKRAAEERAYLASSGLVIDDIDLMIGVSCREYDCTILTGNVEHFRRIRDLSVLNYRELIRNT